MARKVQWAGWFSCALLATSLAATAGVDQSPFTFSMGVRGVYTDNRDGTKRDKKSDFDAIAEPRVTCVYNADNAVFDAFYSPSVLWRSNARKDQNDVDLYHSAGVGIDYRPNARTKLYANDQFDYTDQPNVKDGGATIRENASYYLNRAGAGAQYSLDPKTMLGVSGYDSVKRYTKKVYADLADEDRYGGNGTVSYEVAPETKVSAIGDYSKAEFNQIRHGSEIFMGGAGLDKKFSPNLSAHVQGGWQVAKLQRAIDNQVDSPTASGDVTISPSPATRLILTAGYGLAHSDYDPYAIQTRASASAKIERDLLPNLMVSVAGLYANGHYEKDSVVKGQTAPGGDDTLSDIFVSATYRINRNLTAGLSYEYEDWNSDIRESFSRNTVMASLKADL